MYKKQHIGHVTLKTKMIRVLWNIVYALLFRPAITKLLWPWRWMLLRMFGANVSFKANVYASAKIWAPWNLQMDKNSCLGPHAICYNQAMVILEERSTVSQYAYLCTAGHDSDMQNNASTGLITAPITLGEDSWIGTQAFIGMGVSVGNNAIVGARASVYKDVEPWTIVGGNPAKFIKQRNMIKDLQHPVWGG